ncbi:MAG: ribonuclease HII [Oscillospiraceae bacterium]|nr:ribonuclease HII [Oscillospiraceae bacterium]
MTESPLFEYDKSVRAQHPVFCGLDEAGRGPLAGDVFAAAVIFEDGVYIEGIDDSKKLSEKKREALFDEITRKAAAFCIATASVEEIEKLNILNAALLAMKRACEGLKIKAGYFIADGNKLPDLDIPGEALVKGDGKCASVAAASILAKVSRDRYMKEIAEKYPEWQFEKHKGYGTKLHYEMLDKYGESPVHRPSFLKKYYEKKQQ